jgi:hypothetical protein
MRRRTALPRGALPAALALAFFPFAAPALAATPEAEVKAAYLYKLASFVRWPNENAFGGSFKICVAGRSDVAGVLGQLVRGQQVAGRPVAVEQLSSAQAARTRECQVLFVGRGSAASALFSAARGSPVLTVGDRNNGTRGGVVDFLLRDGRVRLAIDRGAADAQHLELSSKLLDVAVTVTP